MEVIIPENLFEKCHSNQTMTIDNAEISTENGVIRENSLETIRVLNLGLIERHPFMNDFKIKIVYKFEDDEREFISEYDFKVRFFILTFLIFY